MPSASAMHPLSSPLTRRAGTTRHRGVRSPRTCARLARLLHDAPLQLRHGLLEISFWFAPCSLLTEHFSLISLCSLLHNPVPVDSATLTSLI